MSDDQKIWVDHPRWSECWASLEELSGGGQGFARRARRKRDGRVAFLKVIKAKRNVERRVRFFKEASAYNTIRAPGIPRLIESNALQRENDGIEPYIATEFIEGPTLRRWREAQEHSELDTAIETTRELLAIFRACHTGDVVHRDVKPDNIILANGDPGRPVLLDFGLELSRDRRYPLRNRAWTGSRQPLLAPAGALRGQPTQTGSTVGPVVRGRNSLLHAD